MKRRKVTKSAEQRALENDLRAARRNPTTRLIIAQKAEIKRRIDGSTRLTKDFEFLLIKTGWSAGKLLQLLYWDSNMMRADPQTVVKRVKDGTWPIDRNKLKTILKNIERLAGQLELVNKTEFSPARRVILQNSNGMRLSREDERFLLDTFSWIPEILRFYGGELRKNFDRTCIYWERQKENTKYLVDHARRNSLYEGIRLATSSNEYNASRLLRLVNTSREVQKLPPIESRAFVVWLNRLRRHSSTQPVASPFQQHQKQTILGPVSDQV